MLFCLTRSVRAKGKAWFPSVGSSVRTQLKIPGLQGDPEQETRRALCLWPDSRLLHVSAREIMRAVTSEARDITPADARADVHVHSAGSGGEVR